MKKTLTLTLMMLSVVSVDAYTVVDNTVLKVDLTQDSIVASAALPEGNSMNLKDLVSQVGGVAGVNGAYFCPEESAYSRCGMGNKTTSDRYINGQDLNKYKGDTGARGIMGFTKDNEVIFVQNNYGYVPGSYEGNTNQDRYADLYNGIGNFPILLDQGKDVLYAYTAEIDSKMKQKAVKNFICHTEDKRYVFMGSVKDKTIYDMPAYLKEKYGCYNAINLDSGGSTAVYSDGKYLVGPGRNVVDAFVIVAKPKYALTAADRTLVEKIKAKNFPVSVIKSAIRQAEQQVPRKERVIAILKAVVE